jgi:hypothetical protein
MGIFANPLISVGPDTKQLASRNELFSADPRQRVLVRRGAWTVIGASDEPQTDMPRRIGK